VLIILLGQFSVISISQFNWITNSVIIEFAGFEDSETEEEDNKKQKEDLYQTGTNAPQFNELASIQKVLHSVEIQWTHHSEIPTPPPELYRS